MAGGLASAIIGPQLVKFTADAMVIPFMGTYLAVILTNVLGSALFLFLDIPKPPAPQAGQRPRPHAARVDHNPRSSRFR